MTRTKNAASSKSGGIVNLHGRGNRVPMGIDLAAMGHILDRLTDLYPNPIEATARELISNAYDATVLVPEDERKAIHVTLPTVLQGQFVVTDYGVGMSADTIEHVYSQYGASTKMLDMKQIGAYGLGAKAPLAYASEFFGETTHRGVTTVFKVSREKEGNFTTILSSDPSDQPSGTKITVPARVQDAGAFRSAAEVYGEYGFASEISIDGVATRAHDFVLLTDSFLLDPEEGLTSRIWARKSKLPILITDALSSTASSWDYSLSGWRYSRPSKYNQGVGAILVELKPGVVDFSSSRDAITHNVRAEELDARVKDYMVSDEGVAAVFELYRSSTPGEARAVFEACLDARPNRGNQWDTAPDTAMVDGVIQWGKNKFAPTPVERFTLTSGYSPVSLYLGTNEANLYGSLLLRVGSGGTSYCVHKGHRAQKGYEYAFQTESIELAKRNISAAVRTGKPFGSLQGLMNKARHAYGLNIPDRHGYGVRNSTPGYLVVTGIPEDKIATVVGWRSVLGNIETYRDYLMVFYRDGAVAEAEAKVLRDTHEMDNVLIRSYEELDEEVRAARKAARAAAPPKSADDEKLAPATITSDFPAAPETHFKVERLHVNAPVSVKDIVGRGAVLVVGTKKSTWAQVLRGLAGQQDLTGRRVYALDSKAFLSAKACLELADYPYFAVGKDFSSRSKTAQEVTDKHVAHENYWPAELALVKGGRAAFLYLSKTCKFLDFYRAGAALAPGLKNDDLTNVLTAIAELDSVSSSPSPISEEQLRDAAPEFAEATIALRQAMRDLLKSYDMTGRVAQEMYQRAPYESEKALRDFICGQTLALAAAKLSTPSVN